jgi:hypothetical protein
LEWLHVACCSATRAKKSLLFPVRIFARKFRFAETRCRKFFSLIALFTSLILNAEKVSSLRSPWPSYAQVPGGRPNDLRRIIVSLPLPLSPCQTLLEHFHLPFPLAISRSNRRFVYIQRVRPPAPPHKILETLQRHWKHPLLTDVVRMLTIANIVAPRWHHLRSRRYLPWASQAQLANSLAVIYHLTCAPSNSSVSYFACGSGRSTLR